MEFGDRTNSITSLYPHFKTHFQDSGDAHLSYLETNQSFIVASEPMSRLNERKDFVINFFNSISVNKKIKRKVIFPISENLSNQLKEEGFFSWQVGVEPIFDLKQYFDMPHDVLKILF